MESDDEDSTMDFKPEAAEKNTLSLLPPRSRERYECTYNQFMDWCKKQNVTTSLSENVLLAYFDEISGKIAPSTLWTQFSMLRSTLSIHHSVNIAQYTKLKALLKRKSAGYKPKKSKKLTTQEINKFINEASDDKYLLQKVVLIFGICGSCRKHELVQLKIDDIEDLGSAAVIKITDRKTKLQRAFTITGKFYNIYRKYALLRPPETYERRFFLNYQNKKCTKQPVGINKLASTSKQIAIYLALKEPELYTGHCYRRLSGPILMDAVGDIACIQRYEESPLIVETESFNRESLQDEIKAESIIMSALNESSCSTLPMITCNKKFQVEQHLGTAIHKTKKQSAPKLVQQLLSDVPENLQHTFNKDLRNVLVGCDIPISKMNHPLFQEFLKKHGNENVNDFNEHEIKTEDVYISSPSNAGESPASANFDYVNPEQKQLQNIAGEEPDPHPPSASSSDRTGEDQFEIFGTYVASELKSLKSDFLRRKLKRKIQQAIIEISEEDDRLNFP